MIPATHFRDNGDGTAWWVLTASDTIDPATGENYIDTLDRPCGVCGGERLRYDGIHDCDICDGTGRHTIGAEVVEYEPYGDSVRRHSVTYRASVIPGMILPIRDNETDYDPPNHSGDVFICADGTAYIDTPEDYMTDVTLPPAARPGMWALKLRVG